MSAKHKPGPWKAVNHSWCETSILAPDFDHAICCLDINHATEESQEADEAQMAAHAALIAAAPELLEAVDALIKYDESDPDDGIELMRLYAEAVKTARAARAKATTGSAS